MHSKEVNAIISSYAGNIILNSHHKPSLAILQYVINQCMYQLVPFNWCISVMNGIYKHVSNTFIRISIYESKITTTIGTQACQMGCFSPSVLHKTC